MLITTINKEGKKENFSLFKKSKGGVKDSPFVSLSKSGFNFSSGFCKKFGIYGNQYIQLGTGDNALSGTKVIFCTSPDPQKLQDLVEDGIPPHKLVSSGGRNGYALTASEFVRENMSHLYNKIHKNELGIQHFYPEQLSLDGCSDPSIKVFAFQTGASFEKTIDPYDLRSNTSYDRTESIYLYENSEGETIYIGQGSLRDRFMSRVDTWGNEVSTIRYSIISDKPTRLQLEKKATKRYEDKYGCLPKYNQQHGG